MTMTMRMTMTVMMMMMMMMTEPCYMMLVVIRTGLNNVLRMSVTSLVYFSSPCAKHSGKVKFLQDHFIFDHPNSYLRMPAKEKFYEYVRNATH